MIILRVILFISSILLFMFVAFILLIETSSSFKKQNKKHNQNTNPKVHEERGRKHYAK
ncbi:hypothetical protein [Caloramator sp. E03]|uniref:hypothetical protein n=1 Tax=Caloramator sp. E03 TaxID=2576307 RepID=UPI00143D7563|nr:hypothetical protein [Caloramator sp. E03]